MNETHSIAIDFGSGDLDRGFAMVTAQIWRAGNPLPEKFTGSLPAAPELAENYRTWQLLYQALSSRFVLLSAVGVEEDDELEIEEGGITQVSQGNFEDLCQQLQDNLNLWLKSAGFIHIDRQLRSHLNPGESIRVIIETNDDLVRRLPWHRWDFFRDYPHAEMALSRPEYQKPTQTQVKRDRVRILGILGNSKDIDVDRERQFLQDLPDAETEFLVQPSRLEFDRQLWHPQGWDILFFAGHSQTEGQTGRIYINEDRINNSLTIEQLEEALQQAIDNGLKLAIFNSCDGLGLANALARLNLPQVIVMREPVPNRVAQEFFKYFLVAFASDRLPLYLAVRQARRQLQALENEHPGASWLPVICQNPAVEPPTWLTLGGIPPCPYRGLFAFTEEDSRFFFGREKFTSTLVAAVKSQSLVAVVGCSGSGKSSVVFAGLVPQLRRDKQKDWKIASLRPGNNPFEALATALISLYPQPFPLEPAELVDSLRQDRRSLSQFIENLVSPSPSLPLSQSHPSSSHLVLIVDRFEELFTLISEIECQLFLEGLLHAVEFAPAFTLVIVFRADFYGSALAYRPLSDALQGKVCNLSPMNREELQNAIAKPAALMGVKLERGLIEKLVESIGGRSGRLPLLEFALTQLWTKQQNGWLTHQAYAEIGGVESALTNHAETIYAQLSERDRRRMQRVCMQLVKLGEGIEATKCLATRDRIKPENWDLVTRLADARLVVTNRDRATGRETVEIVHEALIGSWTRMGHWLRVDGEFRRWQEQLRMAQSQWEKSDRDEGALLRGKPLADAEYWQEERLEDLSEGDRHFIDLSLALRDREVRQQKRRRHLTVSGLTGGLLVALALTGLAGWQWKNSTLSEINAICKSAKLLAASNRGFDALLQSLKAGKKLQQAAWTGDNPQLRSQVINALKESVYGVRERNRLSGHSGGVYSLSFSPDGQTLVSSGADRAIKLWNADGSLRQAIEAGEGDIYSLRFSPDGKTLASSSTDKTIKLWNFDGTLRQTLVGHQDGVLAIAFSPDGQILASGSADKTIKLWNSDGTLLKTIAGHQGEVRSVSFSPDGQILASGSEDKTIKLWNRDGTLRQTITGYQGSVLSVSFSPDGRILVGTSEDGTIQYFSLDGKLIKRLDDKSVVNQAIFTPDNQAFISVGGDTTVKFWNLDGSMLQTFYGHQDGVLDAAISPDGKRIASGSADGTIKIWYRESLLLNTLQGHQGEVTNVVFSPDDRLLISVSHDKTIKLWNPDGTLLKTLTGHGDVVHGISFSPDGQTFASASWDKTVKLWSREGRLLKTFSGHRDRVYGVSFSPDGQTIASASSDRTVKLWRRDGTLLKTFSGHNDVVHGVSFSPDGQTIASASHDRTVRLWNLEGKLLTTLKGHTNWVHAVSFSPDGKLVASASHDRTVKLWDLDGTLLRTIVGHNDKVLGVTFSPDGQTIASSAQDKTVKLWQLDGTEIATLRGHGDFIHGVSFSHDGKTVASASDDNTVILWNIENLGNLDDLLDRGCAWVKDYLSHNPDGRRDRNLCRR